MTRKKFVKQIMALGYQRNEAQRLADYARRGFWTYEQYLEIEKKYHGLHRKFESFKISLVDNLTPAIKAASKVVSNLAKVITSAIAETQAGKTLLDYAKENAPQIAEHHAADALDAMTYAAQNYQTLLHPLPDNVQVMSHAEHDIMHGYACGIDLAAGPDFTAYKPVMRLDSMAVATGPVIPDMRKKTATELAEEIAEKLKPQGGGGND
jgi:hypothetical protein